METDTKVRSRSGSPPADQKGPPQDQKRLASQAPMAGPQDGGVTGPVRSDLVPASNHASHRGPGSEWDTMVHQHLPGAEQSAKAFFSSRAGITAHEVEFLASILHHYAPLQSDAHGTQWRQRLLQFADQLERLNPALRASPKDALATLTALMEMQLHALNLDGEPERARPLQLTDVERARLSAERADYVRTFLGAMVGYACAWFAAGLTGIAMRGRLDAAQSAAVGALVVAWGFLASQTVGTTIGLVPRWTRGIGDVTRDGKEIFDHHTPRGFAWSLVAYALFMGSMLGTRLGMSPPARAAAGEFPDLSRDRDGLRSVLGFGATVGVWMARLLAPSLRVHPWLRAEAQDPDLLPQRDTNDEKSHRVPRDYVNQHSMDSLTGAMHHLTGLGSRLSLAAPRVEHPELPYGQALARYSGATLCDGLYQLGLGMWRSARLYRGDMPFPECVQAWCRQLPSLAVLAGIFGLYQLALSQDTHPSGDMPEEAVTVLAVAGVLAAWALATLGVRELRSGDPMLMRDAQDIARANRASLARWSQNIERAAPPAQPGRVEVIEVIPEGDDPEDPPITAELFRTKPPAQEATDGKDRKDTKAEDT